MDAAAVILLAAVTTTATAHPHAFVGGGVDVVFRSERVLEALEVTWLFDEFETLYTLSASGVSFDEADEFTQEDQLTLVRQISGWSDEFDGSAHLAVDGEAIALAPPTDVDMQLVDGRLQATLTHRLHPPPSRWRGVERRSRSMNRATSTPSR